MLKALEILYFIGVGIMTIGFINSMITDVNNTRDLFMKYSILRKIKAIVVVIFLWPISTVWNLRK